MGSKASILEEDPVEAALREASKKGVFAKAKASDKKPTGPLFEVREKAGKAKEKAGAAAKSILENENVRSILEGVGEIGEKVDAYNPVGAPLRAATKKGAKGYFDQISAGRVLEDTPEFSDLVTETKTKSGIPKELAEVGSGTIGVGLDFAAGAPLEAAAASKTAAKAAKAVGSAAKGAGSEIIKSQAALLKRMMVIPEEGSLRWTHEELEKMIREHGFDGAKKRMQDALEGRLGARASDKVDASAREVAGGVAKRTDVQAEKKAAKSPDAERTDGLSEALNVGEAPEASATDWQQTLSKLSKEEFKDPQVRTHVNELVKRDKTGELGDFVKFIERSDKSPAEALAEWDQISSEMAKMDGRTAGPVKPSIETVKGKFDPSKTAKLHDKGDLKKGSILESEGSIGLDLEDEPLFVEGARRRGSSSLTEAGLAKARTPQRELKPRNKTGGDAPEKYREPLGPDYKTKTLPRSSSEYQQGMAVLSRGEGEEGALTWLEGIPSRHNDEAGRQWKWRRDGKGKMVKEFVVDELDGQLAAARKAGDTAAVKQLEAKREKFVETRPWKETTTNYGRKKILRSDELLDSDDSPFVLEQDAILDGDEKAAQDFIHKQSGNAEDGIDNRQTQRLLSRGENVDKDMSARDAERALAESEPANWQLKKLAKYGVPDEAAQKFNRRELSELFGRPGSGGEWEPGWGQQNFIKDVDIIEALRKGASPEDIFNGKVGDELIERFARKAPTDLKENIKAGIAKGDATTARAVEAPKGPGVPPSDKQANILNKVGIPENHLFWNDAKARTDFIGFVMKAWDENRSNNVEGLRKKLTEMSEKAANETNPTSATLFRAKRNVLEDILGEKPTVTERLNADSKAASVKGSDAGKADDSKAKLAEVLKKSAKDEVEWARHGLRNVIEMEPDEVAKMTDGEAVAAMRREQDANGAIDREDGYYDELRKHYDGDKKNEAVTATKKPKLKETVAKAPKSAPTADEARAGILDMFEIDEDEVARMSDAEAIKWWADVQRITSGSETKDAAVKATKPKAAMKEAAGAESPKKSRSTMPATVEAIDKELDSIGSAYKDLATFERVKKLMAKKAKLLKK